MNPKSKLYNWAAQKVHSRFAPFWLFVFFILEVILFIPLDAILILYCLEKPSHKYVYAMIATLASTCAAVIGYLVGICLWDAFGPFILDHLISPSFFEQLEKHYQQYESWAVLIGSFLPIPFKAVTVSAGVCKLSFFLFLTAVFCGRAFRFFALSKAMGKWREQIRTFLQKSLHKVLTIAGAKIALTFAFFWALGHG
jgi:membrane protein YqaA with SNARE-associated domain